MKNNWTLKSDITSIAIGGFDGMHLAHQELFKMLDKNGALFVVETGYANLTPKINRVKYSSYPLYYYDLNEIKHLNAQEFVNLLKEEYINLQTIVVGYDFRFGSMAKANTNVLKKLFKGEIKVLDEYSYKNIAVHSSVIRDYISSGDIITANMLLGKKYIIDGIHIKGQGLGAKQFVATINLEVKEFLYPEQGIYATNTIVNNISYKSVTFIGHRFTTDGKFAIETHIIDEVLDDINSHVSIEFICKIRDNQKFEVYKDLQNQILNDISMVKDMSY